MRVLGIDPGLTRCGLGVVDGAVGRPLTMVDVGVVRTGADLPLAERLRLVAVGIEEWLERHRPDRVAVERVFSQHNVRTVMGTAQASGVALVAAAHRGLPVVTRPGAFMRGRHAYGILRMLGVTDTIAASEAEYVQVAVRLGQEPTLRQQVRERIIATHDRLYGDRACVQALETFFEQAVGRTRPGRTAIAG